jgi:hypothetical protein
LQWRLRKSPAVPFQVLNDGLGDLEAAFFNYALAETRDLHFLQGDGDIEDQLLIKRESPYRGTSARVPKA